MTVHAKYSLRGSSVFEVVNLAVAHSTLEASGTESLVAGENGKILNLVTAGTAAVGTVIADERAIAEE